MKRSAIKRVQDFTTALLFNKLGIPVDPTTVEVADFGKGVFATEGLAIVVLTNQEYCGKLLVMSVNQLCPTHRHPPIPAKMYPGKQETFIVLAGTVWVAIEDDTHPKALPIPPRFMPSSNSNYPALPGRFVPTGGQVTIPRGKLHWFQAGHNSPAIVLEVSSQSFDEHDEFIDPAIHRMPEIVED